jgi:phage/plasmid-associated DNA primase
MDTTRPRGSRDASRTRPDEVETDGKEPDGVEPDGEEKARPYGRPGRDSGGASEEEEPEEEGPEEEGGGRSGKRSEAQTDPEAQSDSETETEPEAQNDPWVKARRAYDEEGRGEGREAAAQRLSEEHFFAAPGTGGDLYVYDAESAVFKPNGRRVIEETIRKELGPRHSTTEVRQIEAKVRADAPGERLGTAEVIPLANGDLPARQLEPSGPLKLLWPNPERPFLRRSKAWWDPSAECPTLDRILQQAVSSRDERHTLQEYAGYCLLHWARPFQTALLLVGPGREAKRAYLRALNAIVPWVSSVAPRRLAKSRSKGPQLHGPWVNIGTGISPGALPKTEFFHEFGPGSPARSDSSQLGGREEQPVPRRAAKHVYTADSLPEIYPGESFFRRIELVSFSEERAPEKPWPKFAKDLEAERDGILRWAIEGLRRLLREEGFSLGDPSDSPGRSPEKTRAVWESHGDSISRFKAEQLEVTGDRQRHFVPKEKTYEAYRRFCQAQGLRPIEKKRALTRRLKGDSRIDDGKRTPEGHDGQKRCYEGVALREG